MKKCISCQKSFDSPGWACPLCGFSPSKRGKRLVFAPELALENDGFDPSDFARLSESEAGHFWFESRNRLILWALGKYFPDARSFLEVGCGGGYVLSEIEKRTSLALGGGETYHAALDLAEERLKRAELFQLDARKIPFAEEFDCVGAFDVIEHIREDGQVLAQMREAVRPGGGILLTVPQHKFLWSDSDRLSFHVRRYEARELRAMVEKAGFRVETTVSFFFSLLPFVAVSRLLWRRKLDKDGPKVELKINPVLNWMFGRIMDLEGSLIRLGARPPWGSTLLLVAKKD